MASGEEGNTPNVQNAGIQGKIHDLLGELPSDFRSASKIGAELELAFHNELATLLQPRLKEYLATLPQESLVDKQDLAAYVNGELRRLGLTIRFPKTGRPAILIADYGHVEHPDVSRFRLKSSDDGGRRVYSSSSATVPDLELMRDPPRRESLSRGFSERNRELYER